MNKALLAVLTSALLSLAVSGCGGGGGGGGSGDSANPPVNTPAATASNAVALVSSQPPSGGVIPAGAAKDVTASYTGAASAGELLQVSVNFAKNTYSWKVLQSSYGITGQNSNGTLAVATSGGGYAMSGGGSLFLTQAGSIQINGLTLTIGGQATQVAVSAQPPASSAPTLVDIAGTYAFGLFAHDAGVNPPYDGNNASIGWGTAKINADGTGRLCPEASTYSDSCVNAETSTPITLTLKAGDSQCSAANNLFGVYLTQAPNTTQPPVTDFAGCAVLSSNGTGNVVYLDKQASSNGNIDPGFITMVQLPASGEAVTVQNGSYTETTIADLATSPTNDCSSPFVFANGTVRAQCVNGGTTQTQTFTVNTQSPLPAGVLGIGSGGTVSSMLLSLSTDTWLRVLPTSSIYGTDATESGSVGIFKRTGS
jgi:hypothetical protein